MTVPAELNKLSCLDYIPTYRPSSRSHISSGSAKRDGDSFLSLKKKNKIFRVKLNRSHSQFGKNYQNIKLKMFILLQNYNIEQKFLKMKTESSSSYLF